MSSCLKAARQCFRNPVPCRPPKPTWKRPWLLFRPNPVAAAPIFVRPSSRALALPRTAGVSRIVVVATDGYVHVENQVFDLIRQNLGQANLFPFGIGTSVNRHLIEGMARAGMGEPFVILNQQEAVKQAARFKDYIAKPVLTDIKVKFNGFAAKDVEPQALPDLFALRPLTLLGKYTGRA